MSRLPASRTIVSKNDVGYLHAPVPSSYFSPNDLPGDTGPRFQQSWERAVSLPTDLYTICLITCYSEDEESIRKTLDAVAGTR